jgi:hypothetical protein
MKTEIKNFSQELKGFRIKLIDLRRKLDLRQVLSNDWKVTLKSESRKLEKNLPKIPI